MQFNYTTKLGNKELSLVIDAQQLAGGKLEAKIHADIIQDGKIIHTKEYTSDIPGQNINLDKAKANEIISNVVGKLLTDKDLLQYFLK